MTTPQQDAATLAAVVPAPAARAAAWPTTRHWALAGVVLIAAALPLFFHGFVIFQLT